VLNSLDLKSIYVPVMEEQKLGALTADSSRSFAVVAALKADASKSSVVSRCLES
jgi:hypothetical protein